MKTKYILAMLMCVMLIGLASAATDTKVVDDTFQINKQINYAKPCFNNGTYCSDSATCNLSVIGPDSVVAVNNQLMENNGAYHNYTFSPTKLGVHKANIICLDGGLNGADTFYFEVTGSGLNDDFKFNLIILGISFGIMLLGFFIKDGWVTVFGTFGLYFVAIDVLKNGIAGIQNLTTTWAIALILLGLAAYISVRSAHEMITD